MKEKVNQALMASGYAVGCWDRRLNTITNRQLAYLVKKALQNQATHGTLTLNEQKFLVQIDTIDNEKDFTLADYDWAVEAYGLKE